MSPAQRDEYDNRSLLSVALEFKALMGFRKRLKLENLKIEN